VGLSGWAGPGGVMVSGSRAADPVTETQFQPSALGQLFDLWYQVMPGDAPDQARFRDLALLNPAFAPEGLIMLWRGSRLIGFGLAIAERGHPGPGMSRQGWLVAMGVVPGEQGAGHGSRLLESCLRFLAASGCAVAELGGNCASKYRIDCYARFGCRQHSYLRRKSQRCHVRRETQ